MQNKPQGTAPKWGCISGQASVKRVPRECIEAGMLDGNLNHLIQFYSMGGQEDYVMLHNHWHFFLQYPPSTVAAWSHAAESQPQQAFFVCK